MFYQAVEAKNESRSSLPEHVQREESHVHSPNLVRFAQAHAELSDVEEASSEDEMEAATLRRQ